MLDNDSIEFPIQKQLTTSAALTIIPNIIYHSLLQLQGKKLMFTFLVLLFTITCDTVHCDVSK